MNNIRIVNIYKYEILRIMIYLYQKSLVLVSANYKRHLFEFFEMLLMHF